MPQSDHPFTGPSDLERDVSTRSSSPRSSATEGPRVNQTLSGASTGEGKDGAHPDLDDDEWQTDSSRQEGHGDPKYTKEKAAAQVITFNSLLTRLVGNKKKAPCETSRVEEVEDDDEEPGEFFASTPKDPPGSTKPPPGNDKGKKREAMPHPGSDARRKTNVPPSEGGFLDSRKW